MKYQFNKLFSFVLIFSLMFGGIGQAQAQGQNPLAQAQNIVASPAAAPASPTDETKVPHYYGPYPNFANSPLTIPDATVTIIPATTVPATVSVGNPLIDRSNATDYATAPGILAPVFVVIPSVVLPAGTLTNFQTWNQATPAGSPTPSAGSLFHAYVLRPTGIVVNQYQVVYDSGELTVPALTTPGVSELATFPVTPGFAVQAGDVLGFYGQGVPVDVGGGMDILSYLATTNPDLATPAAPVQNDTISVGTDAGFPLYSQDRTYSFGATVDPAAFVDPGMGAAATATVNPATGAITGYTITNPGSGYLSAPTVSITSANGSNATATAVLDPFLMLTSIAVDPGGAGAGYTAPAIAITGGGASTDATAHASGSVDSIVLTNGGSGFNQQPMVEISWPDDPAGTRATASATMTNGVVDPIITIVDPGSGYYSAPTVTITDGLYPSYGAGIDATATSTLAITGITLDTFGSGYITVPTVSITDTVGTGSNAAATAVVTSGSISAITPGNPGSGYLTPGIKKFVDTLPGLGPTSANNLGQYISVAVPDKTTYPGADYYEIAVVQYREKMHTNLPPTLLREYVQLSTNVVPGAHVALSNANLTGPDTPINGYFGVDNPHYLGPTIIATKDRPVRILFRNLLPTGVAGDLFIPVDTTVMGSGMGPLAPQMPPMDQGSVMDEVRNPMCNDGFNANPDLCFTQNRATLHLHGGVTPWISDGTPHQWITPAGENTSYPEGVSVSNVPDMPDPGPGAQTFFYTNQQSARLMFYHDHSWGITRLNVYAGEAAGYVLTDAAEQALMSAGGPLAGLGYGIPLIIQDKTFVPSPSQLAQEDPTWDSSRWGGEGNLWVPHVMMPAQNPGSSTGQSDFGRWMYGPYFWPPATPKYGPIANPYYDPNCDPNVVLPDGSNQFCEPPLIPGVPNQSVGMEAFNDTPVVNGTVYPTTTLDPKSYRFRILNAANDRFWNLQWYVADSTGTEVALNAAEVAAAQTNPDIIPSPDLALSPAGPDWIQIGTEGGFLPTPTVVSGHQITTYITNPTRFDIGNVDQHSLLLAPAERGDVIVDFSKFAGKTLILYNDAPAAFPARVAGYDYYTGDPDMTGSGGAPTTLPGYGPNTRTIMQVKIAAKTPATAFKMAPLNAAFAHHLVNGQPAGVFESSEDPIIVGQGAYNTAYGSSFRSAAPLDGFARINDQSLTFNTLLNGAAGATMTMPFQNKGIHDEMNSAVFDEYGRMSANLGLEAPGATPLTQNIILYPYINPTSETINGIELPYGASGSLKVTPISSAADGTQIWKLTHNGVDTHPLHFHLANVQVLNRVTWDNIILKPEASELGWKDTVRVSPLEDTIVAIRPIIPKSPFGLPDSIRPLNPAMPIGDASGFNNTDFLGNPLTGANTITNQLTNFGWEYVWHCHILGHEEMDMMRPIKINVSRALPAAPVLSAAGGSGAPINLSWTDGTPVDMYSPATWGDPSAEIGYRVERARLDIYGLPGAYSVVGTALANATSFTDNTTVAGWDYSYRVIAYNAAGDSQSNAVNVLTPPPADPTNLIATAVNANQIDLTWTDNAVTETGFRIERALVTGGTPGAFAPIDGVGADITAYTDSTVAPNTTYAYQVFAFNLAGDSLPSNIATATTPDVPPAAPTTLIASAVSANQVDLAWADNAANETGFRVERALVTGGVPGAFAAIGTVGVDVIAYSDTTAASNTTYAYQVFAFNVLGDSLPSNIATATTYDVPPVAPANLTATAISANQVDLAWADNAANETGFRIERALVTGGVPGAFSAIGTVGVDVIAYSDITAAPNTTYAYQVFAFNLAGDSLSSNVATATTFDAPPAAPTGLTAVLQNGPQVGLAWTDNASNETSFALERAVNGGGFVVLASLPVDTISYVDTTVIAGNTYTYQVMAANAGGPSAYSNTASVTLVPLPAAPTNLTATLISLSRIDLAWLDNATTETGFVVERSVNGGVFTMLTTVPTRAGTGNVTYRDTTVVTGNIYSYRVMAINASGASAYSNVVIMTVGAAPAAPTNLTDALLGNPLRVRLTWRDNANNETNFVLERSDNGGAFTILATVPARNGVGNVTYNDTTVLAGNTYSYRVMAVNGVGFSAYSNIFTVAILPPAAPSNVVVTAVVSGNNATVTLTWTDNANNESGFEIQRATNAAFTAGLNARTVAANTVLRTETRTRNRTYYYRIRAINPVGASAWVNAIPFPILTP